MNTRRENSEPVLVTSQFRQQGLNGFSVGIFSGRGQNRRLVEIAGRDLSHDAADVLASSRGRHATVLAPMHLEELLAGEIDHCERRIQHLEDVIADPRNNANRLDVPVPA